MEYILPTGTSQGIAVVIIKGKTAGEIPSVFLSNRKTTTHFKERGILICCTENCQLTLTFISLLIVSLNLTLIGVEYSTSKKSDQVAPPGFILILQGDLCHPQRLQITQQNSSFQCLGL